MTFTRPQASAAGVANRIDRLREELRVAEATNLGDGVAVLPLGIPAIDDALGGGLARGALHEIAAACEPEGAAATGFALALAAGSNDRPLRPLIPARGTPSRSRDGDPVAGIQNLDARLRGHERTSGLSVMPTRKTVVWIAED